MRQWRFIYDKPAEGALNMAIDEAILQAVSAKHALPTLRVYGWQPFCLSLGYGQHASDADFERMKKHGWDAVRRPTGGKAILHGDELTYSVALPIDHELAQGDVVTSYRRISEALMIALQHLGLSPHSEQVPKGNQGLGAVCFEVPSHYEITVEGRKLIGSAQVRRKEGILQHGTLPLRGDIARICDALAYPDEVTRHHAKTQVRERATTLSRVLGYDVAYHDVAHAFVKGFSDAFDLDMAEGVLSTEEAQNAQALRYNTYDTIAWTQKR